MKIYLRHVNESEGVFLTEANETEVNSVCLNGFQDVAGFDGCAVRFESSQHVMTSHDAYLEILLRDIVS